MIIVIHLYWISCIRGPLRGEKESICGRKRGTVHVITYVTRNFFRQEILFKYSEFSYHGSSVSIYSDIG